MVDRGCCWQYSWNVRFHVLSLAFAARTHIFCKASL